MRVAIAIDDAVSMISARELPKRPTPSRFLFLLPHEHSYCITLRVSFRKSDSLSPPKLGLVPHRTRHNIETCAWKRAMMRGRKRAGYGKL